jgi:hypothetical protein
MGTHERPKYHDSLRRPGVEPRGDVPWHVQADAARRRRAMRPDAILVGAKQICDYMQISAINTLERWVDQFGFPAIKRPDGKWLSSITAIDEWIWLAAELHAEGKRQLDRIAERALLKPAHIKREKPYTHSHIERAERSGHDIGDVLATSAIKRNLYNRRTE